MPIKFPKTLSRRRLSGNALDEADNSAPVPSFRVLERPAGSGKSFDGGSSLKRQLVDPQQRPLSEGRWDEKTNVPIPPPGGLGNRGSGGTANSSHSGNLLYDSSSARYSSSSTLPSSSSIGASSDEISHAHPKPQQSLPIPAIPASSSGFSLRAAGRTFSFGRKAVQAGQQAVTPPSQTSGTSTDSVPATPTPGAVLQPLANRPRTHTETSYTSGGTARAPHVLDTKLDFHAADDPDDFSNMFDGLGAVDGRTKSHGDQYIQRAPFSAPPPVRVDIERQITPAPYSSDSRNSRDALMTASPREEPQAYGSGIGYENGHHANHTPRPLQRQSTAPDLSSSPGEPSWEKRSELKRNSGYVRRKSLALLDGGDHSGQSSPITASSGLLARKPLPARDANERYSQHTPISLFDGETIDLDDFGSAQPADSARTSTAKNVEDGLLNDPAFQAMARSAAQYHAGVPSRKEAGHVDATPKKVMTPAQFERYRQEKEMERMNDPASESDSSSDAYDEEDEEERTKAIEKQRKTQEARMSVYRQQMMKVTGEQTPNPRPNVSRLSQGAPALQTRRSMLSLGPTMESPTKVSDDDDDDDIPLGILAAHGFPTKNRAPTQLRERSSQPNIRYTSETYPPPTMPTAGSAAGRGTRGTLPPFARGLPQDPYYGASLVNPSKRESLAFGNTRPASAYGGAPSAKLPPGGLVGVIASTERARAIRRGDPVAVQAPFDVTAGPASPQVVNEQSAQIAQLTQAVMQQAQMMQQMLALQSPQTQMQMQMQMPRLPPNLSIPPSLAAGPSPGLAIPRPASASPTTLLRPGNHQGRAMSMLSPNTARISFTPGTVAGTRTSTLSHPTMSSSNVNLPAGYAASLAPSERSGLGPMRYRPVSMVVEEAATGSARTSTISGVGVAAAWQAGPTGQTREQVAGQMPVMAKVGPKVAKAKVEVEDDDAEWARVRAKREKKRGDAKSAAEGSTQEAKGLDGVFYPLEEDISKEF